MKDKIFTIDNIDFIIAIAILTFWLTFVTAKGGLTNDNFTGQWWERITNRGKIAAIILTMLPIILVLQEVNNRNISYNSSLDLLNEQKQRDEKITKGIKSGVTKETDKIFKNLSEAFKKQGLQYDLVKNEVIKLRDSLKTIKNSGEPPVLYIEHLKIVDSINFDKFYKVEFKISSLVATSYNINLAFDILAVTPKSNIITLNKNFPILYKGQTIEASHYISNYVLINKDVSLYSYYVFRLKGECYQSNKVKVPIDNIYFLYPMKKTDYFSLPGNEIIYSRFRSYFKSQNL